MKGFINLTHTNNGKIAKAKSELQTEIQNAINGIIETFYNKQQVQQLIANLAGITFKKVEILPTENIITNVIYLVPVANAEEQNLYEEYMYIDDVWEKIGTTAIDLSNYITTEEYNKLVNNETQISNNGKFQAGGSTECGLKSTAIGEGAKASHYAVAIGYGAKAEFDYCTAVGQGSYATNGSDAFGRNAKANRTGSVQLGAGTNNVLHTLQFGDDNIYNKQTHTLTVQNIELDGENVLNMFPTIEEIDDDEEV